MQTGPSPSAPAVLLASGGMDSTVLAYWLLARGIDFVPVFVDYGQVSSRTEEQRVRTVLPPQYAEKVQLVCVSDVYRQSSSRMIVETDLWRESLDDEDLYVPGRNLLLLSIGAAYAGSISAKSLYSAFIESNLATGVDCSTRFLEAVRTVLGTFYGVALETPFTGFSKRQVAALGLKHGAPIDRTFSCLLSARVPCGACSNCVDREQALKSIETGAI
jgi:7-cyano-7-deazaguanine synthase